MNFDRLAEWLPAVGFFSAVAVLLTLSAFVPPSTVVRAGYGVVGAMLAWVVTSVTERRLVSDESSRVSGVTYAKVLTILASLAIGTVALTGERVVALLVFLPVGYLLVAVQLCRRPPVTTTCYQLAMLFAVPLLAKYLSTGMYFGASDVFFHLRAVRALVSGGSFADIPIYYSIHPNYHLVVATVRAATGLPTYEALVFTGISLFTALVAAAFLVGERVARSNLVGFGTAMAFTAVDLPSYSAFYFTPRAFGFALLLVGLSLTVRLLDTTDRTLSRRLSVVVVAVVAVIPLTHHLMFFLALIPFGTVLAFGVAKAALERPAKGPVSKRVRYSWAFPVVLWLVALFSYWMYSASTFLRTVTYAIVAVLLYASEGGTSTYAYGITLPVDDVGQAIAWFQTPGAIYFTAFTALLLVGGYATIRNPGRETPLVLAGTSLGVLLLPLPVGFLGLYRLEFTVTLVVIFAIGLGIARTVSVTRTAGSGTSGFGGGGRLALALLVLVAAIGTAGAFTAATGDDVPELNAVNNPTAKTSFEESEFRMLKQTAEFLRAHRSGAVSTDKTTRLALQLQGLSGLSGLEPTATRLRASPGLVVTRSGWRHNQVPTGEGFTQGSFGYFLVSERRYAESTARYDKVYATGGFEILNSQRPYRLFEGANRTAFQPNASE
ncbi:hypothetical protein [Halorussus lipolyticus]|uniref:hypothetical protein n=1 Tax=Halorussus lipolyticus TaxID=3034024 RepID=UPI0023E775BA|nr:hypothetical protein [Halorussus sp. DT80]